MSRRWTPGFSRAETECMQRRSGRQEDPSSRGLSWVIFMRRMIKIWRWSVYMLPEDHLSAPSQTRQHSLVAAVWFLWRMEKGELDEMNETNNPTVRRKSGEEGHDGVNTRVKACRSALLFLRQHRGRWRGRRKWDAKWHENVSSALFMNPVEEDGRQLRHVSHPPHTYFLF